MFIEQQIYNRKKLHDEYGGNRQSGISASAKNDIIFLFTGKSGEQYGYQDHWDEEFFFYTGEGTTGDMELIKGNKAILNHRENKKRLYLFEGNGKGNCTFISEMEYVNFEFFKSVDVNKEFRTAIKFALKRIPQFNNNIESNKKYSKPKITERNGLITSRVGQGWYRLRVLERWDYKCAVLNVDTSPILIASHIKPWRFANDEERLDPANGILLSPNIDALFDKNILSFDNDGKVLLTDKISDQAYRLLGITKQLRLSKINDEMIKYLEYHQKLTFNKI